MSTAVSHIRRMLVILMLGAAAGCATTDFAADTPLRPATDTPERFLVGSHDGPAISEPVPGEGCRNPMVDPRDDTRILLIRSDDRRGDYEVPSGRYGLSRGELLRLDCGTGRPLGVVRR